MARDYRRIALEQMYEASKLLTGASSNIKKATIVKFEMASLTAIVLENLATVVMNIYTRLEGE